jgi:ADP-ribose pyrophosphatase
VSLDPLFTSHNFSVEQRNLVYDFDGHRKNIDVVVQPDTVIAVPVLDSGDIVMVEHWRPILDRTLLECPGGKVEAGETLEGAMRRELSEEIGLRPRKLTKLGSFFTSVGTSTERISCFIAEGLDAGGARDKADSRRMHLRNFSQRELRSILDKGILSDGKSEIALSRYFKHGSTRL